MKQSTAESVKSVGSFIQIHGGEYKVLTFHGVLRAKNIEFSERFRRQVKLYCYPFIPGMHLLSEVVVEFLVSDNSIRGRTLILEKILGDNREKNWNRWVELLSGLGPSFQGEKVEGIYFEHATLRSKLQFIQYQSPSTVEESLVELIRQSSAGRASGFRFTNGVHAVRAFGRMNLWRAVPSIEETLNQPLSSNVRQSM